MSNNIKIHSYTREKPNEKEKQKPSTILDSKAPKKYSAKLPKHLNQISIKKDLTDNTKNNNRSNITIEKKRALLTTPTSSKSQTRHTINCTISPCHPRYLPSLQYKSPNNLIQADMNYLRSKTPLKTKYSETKSRSSITNISKQRMNCTSNDDFIRKDNSMFLNGLGNNGIGLSNSNVKELQIILSLKKKIKAQNDELQSQIDTIAVLNKDKQITFNKELQIEIEVLNAEIVRMKNMILVTESNEALMKQIETMKTESQMQSEYFSKENEKLKKNIFELRSQIGIGEEENEKLKCESKKLIEEYANKEKELKEKHEQMIKDKDEEHHKDLKALEEQCNKQVDEESGKCENVLANQRIEYENRLSSKDDECKCEISLKMDEHNAELNQLKVTIKELEEKVEELNRISKEDKVKYEEMESKCHKLSELVTKAEEEKKQMVTEREEMIVKLKEEINTRDTHEQAINQKDDASEDNMIEIPTLMSLDEINEISYLIRRTIQALQLTQEELLKQIGSLPETNLIESLTKTLLSISKSKSDKDYWILIKYLFSLSLTDDNDISLPKLKKELLRALSTTSFKENTDIIDLVKTKANDLLSYCQKGDYLNKGLISYEQLTQIIQLVFEKEENLIGKIKDYLIVKLKECPNDEASLYNLNYSKLNDLAVIPQYEPLFKEDTNNIPNQANQEGNGLLLIENKPEGELVRGTIESNNQMIFCDKQEPNLLIEDTQEKDKDKEKIDTALTPEELVICIKKYLNDNQVSFNALLLSFNSKITTIGDSKWLSLPDFTSLIESNQICLQCNESSFDLVYLSEAKDMLNITSFSLLFENDNKDVNIELIEEVPTEENNVVQNEREDSKITSKFLDDVFAGVIAKEMEIKGQPGEQNAKEEEVKKEEEDAEKQIVPDKKEIEDQAKEKVEDEDGLLRKDEEEEQKEEKHEVLLIEENEDQVIVKDNADIVVKSQKGETRNTINDNNNNDDVEELVCVEVKQDDIEELVAEPLISDIINLDKTDLQQEQDNKEEDKDKNKDDIYIDNNKQDDNDNTNNFMTDHSQSVLDPETDKAIGMAANRFVFDLFTEANNHRSINEYYYKNDIEVSKENDVTNNITTNINANDNSQNILSEKENGANDNENEETANRIIKNDNGSPVIEWEDNLEQK